MFKNSGFDKLLDKATSHLLMEPDWSSIMQICDQIRQDDIQPKYALNSIKKKLLSPNPHSAMFALLVLESVVKNCPSAHEELTSRAYCDVLHEYVKTTTHANVKEKMLELLQVWNSVIARKNPKHSNLKDLVAIMKAEGFSFPAFRESEAMFAADSAPKWVDGEVCHHCRVQFGVMQRKHHCRACGQVFCGQCTQRSAPLPRFGIEKEVRVCDACYEQHTRPYTSIPTTKDGADLLPAEYLKSSLAQQSQQPPPKRSEEELREEEELQLAIALSQSEAEAKEKEKKRIGVAAFKEQQQQQLLAKAFEVEVRDSTPEDPPELSRYLNRSYWENRQSDSNDIKGMSVSASAPTQLVNLKDDDDGSVDIPIEDFTNTLRSQVEIFINRMKSNSSRGRSIANDSSVQTLFMNLTTMHSQLLKHIQQLDDKRIYYEGLQDKLTQVKDARAALDALREEHREKLRRQAEEAERLRQLQMAHKLDIMRKKKQEYLQYQRQMALQRVQEQEREMQMRQEQQKQQYMTNPQYGSYIPYPGNPQSIANYYQYGQPSMVMGYPGCAPPPSQHVQIPPPPGIQGVPQSVPNLPGAPQSIPNHPGAPLPQMGQMPMHPHHTASQGMVPQQQQQQPMSLPQFQQQQPGAPPPSPQIGGGGQPGTREEEETQTAELITFD